MSIKTVVKRIRRELKIDSPDDCVPVKLFSLEMLGSIIITVFLFGGGWVGVNRAIASNETTIKEVKKKQEEVVRSINIIKTDVAILVSKQELEHQAADARANRQQKTIDRILDILQRRLPD